MAVREKRLDANGDGWVLMDSKSFYGTTPPKALVAYLNENYPSIDTTSLDTIFPPQFKVWKGAKVAIKTGFYHIENGALIREHKTTEFEFQKTVNLAKSKKVYPICPNK